MKINFYKTLKRYNFNFNKISIINFIYPSPKYYIPLNQLLIINIILFFLEKTLAMSWVDDDDDDVRYFSDNSFVSDDGHCYGIDDNDNANEQPVNRYTVLAESDIQNRQNEQISHLSSLFSVSNAEAIVLLCHYKWDPSRLLDQWFDDEATIRNKAGLLVKGNNVEKSKSLKNKRYSCGICFEEDFLIEQICSANCNNHYYCISCWKSYISTSINESGLGSLTLRCPEPKCPAIVGQDMISKLTSKKDEKKYLQYFIRSYVDSRVNIKWCPSPGCDRAVELEHGGTGEYDVTCDCSHSFCWNCGEDCHRPLECKIVLDWIVKNNSEAENTMWILAYTKPCPKCKRHIEKNHGCSHMTCSAPCRYEFCWLCLGDWMNHSGCNRYTQTEEKQRTLARQSIIRYTHYYERWASNHKSMQKAIQDLHNLQTIQLPELSDRVSVPVTQLEFIVESWKQIIECRRVLKWTYAYGFFMPEHEDVKKKLFEYLQGEAELGLERLHHCAEIELSKKLLGDEGEIKAEFGDFGKFRAELIKLTKVTGTYFENLVTGLENGLSEVVSSEVPPVDDPSDVLSKTIFGQLMI
ncbi:putative E3 ubiquitin-protein ligase ARI10 [Silene latifolia]|uniref:putative E3 ubiquitin-protein ligase ARI10 n=1 Tax=Silene latifolia TaxID=37657 RepID=UPI003D788430